VNVVRGEADLRLDAALVQAAMNDTAYRDRREELLAEGFADKRSGIEHLDPKVQLGTKKLHGRPCTCLLQALAMAHPGAGPCGIWLDPPDSRLHAALLLSACRVRQDA
jgi:hypothetical protein